MKNNPLLIGLSLLLCALLLFCAYTESVQSDQPDSHDASPIVFHILSGEVETSVAVWSPGQEYFVFLPAYAAVDQMWLELRTPDPVYLDGTQLISGMNCGCFDPDKDYTMTVGSDAPVRFHFLRSANVASMFINTVSGTMDEVHSDKTHRERTHIAVINPDGGIIYQTPLADEIRGHGNSTWELEKKSYNLYLGQEADLFGMGPAEKYVLISNAIDDTNLRNRIVYDFARQVSPYDGFSPECEYVDLYLNGDYAGLYLLCEKPEIHRSRLDISTEGCLFEVTAYGQENRKQFFELNDGIFVEIHFPDPCTAGLRDALEFRLKSMQTSLLSADTVLDSSVQFWRESIDLDSWARKYLIEEIFENSDCGFFSQYYFCTAPENPIYAGPCWDYDGTMGMFDYLPNCFLAQRDHLNNNLYQPWYAALWQKEEFRSYVMELYRHDFLPELNRLLNDTLPALTGRLQIASELNRLRWFDAIDNVSDSISEMETYLRAHIDFLSSAWVEGIDYHTITLKRSSGGEYLYYCVPDGSDCLSMPKPDELGSSGDCWYLEGSGEVFDPAVVVTADMSLTAYKPMPPDPGQEAGET